MVGKRSFIFAFATLAVFACKKEEKGSSTPTSATLDAAPPVVSSSASKNDLDNEEEEAITDTGKNPDDKGDFSYHVKKPKSPAFAKFKPIFTGQLFPSILHLLNDNLLLPRDIPVIATQCGMENAFYAKDKHAVVLCYELAAFFDKTFNATYKDTQRALQYTNDALAFVAIHELGHALIGELELGVVGGEEDAVDDFGAVFLVAVRAPEKAMAGAEAMGSLGAGAKPKFFDEHSLGAQRFFNIACSVYGSDPKRFARIVPAFLPPPRAVRCPDEFKKKAKGWDAMLKPYTKKKT